MCLSIQIVTFSTLFELSLPLNLVKKIPNFKFSNLQISRGWAFGTNSVLVDIRYVHDAQSAPSHNAKSKNVCCRIQSVRLYDLFGANLICQKSVLSLRHVAQIRHSTVERRTNQLD